MKNSSRYLALILATAFVSPLTLSAPLDEWEYLVPPGWWWDHIAPESSRVGLILNSIAADNGRVVAVGHFGIALVYSEDQSWEVKNLGDLGGGAQSPSLYAITVGNSTFVAVGSHGAIRTSPDGVLWTKQTIRENEDCLIFSGVTYGNGRFVAVGTNTGPDCLSLFKGVATIYVSTDGVTWESVEVSGFEGLGSVIFGDSKFVAIGASGTILFSNDGESWIPSPSDPELRLRNLSYGNGTFAIEAETRGTIGNLPESVVLSSNDGEIWSRNEFKFGEFVFGDGVLVGGNGLNEVVSSTDGVSWKVHKLELEPPNYFLQMPAYDDGFFYALGWNEDEQGYVGSILRSSKVTSEPPDSSVAPELEIAMYAGLTVSGQPGQTFQIEFTDSIEATASWTPLTTLTLQTSDEFFVDRTSKDGEKRFYRAVSVQ